MIILKAKMSDHLLQDVCIMFPKYLYHFEIVHIIINFGLGCSSPVSVRACVKKKPLVQITRQISELLEASALRKAMDYDESACQP